ncbi:alpha/beta fold hydrolase [Sansalvadorimonas verongulae]|uniref:alpha/beta fold hydrolase n=1 Tax=Sansalvadorimonas verongulae TaxID=2172824 RepID=UPI0012BB6131|nr:alpha/beta fold hydrolase [Sansalvadorimonas verongulae]MTI14224.1 alpha/beta fold hydrolase [Sansalvadorimonas verongulae]
MSRVILVSGWCMSADVMSPLEGALVDEGFSVSSLSLADAEGESWDALLSALDLQVGEQPALLVGWSLGGNLCARYAAQNPDKVSGLVTMGSTPRFVAADDWPAGKHPDAYQEFADGIAADIQLTMKGFAPICARGSENLKATIRTLRASVKWAISQPADWRVLLDRLAEDARPQWKDITCPAVHLLAESDPLAKAGIADDLKKLAPAHNVQVLSGSHAIFLDHTEAVVHTIKTIL